MRVGDKELVVTANGAIRIERLTKTIVRHTTFGTGTDEFLKPITDSCNVILDEQGEIVVFIDSWDQPKIEPSLRENLGAYLKSLGSKNAKAYMLVPTPWLAISMNIANTLAGNKFITTVSSIDEWEKLGKRYIFGFCRNPIIKTPTSYR